MSCLWLVGAVLCPPEAAEWCGSALPQVLRCCPARRFPVRPVLSRGRLASQDEGQMWTQASQPARAGSCGGRPVPHLLLRCAAPPTGREVQDRGRRRHRTELNWLKECCRRKNGGECRQGLISLHKSAPGATRTRNLRIRRPLLYPLSYGGNHTMILRTAPPLLPEPRHGNRRAGPRPSLRIPVTGSGTAEKSFPKTLDPAASKPGSPEVIGV